LLGLPQCRAVHREQPAQQCFFSSCARVGQSGYSLNGQIRRCAARFTVAKAFEGKGLCAPALVVDAMFKAHNQAFMLVLACFVSSRQDVGLVTSRDRDLLVTSQLRWDLRPAPLQAMPRDLQRALSTGA
jgi:hypothetical protein